MSKLYLSEDGHIVPTLYEELTRYRISIKILHLSRTSAPGQLLILACCYHDSNMPLRLSVNNFGLPPLEPNGLTGYL